jgi:2-keto-3-deoxy-L-rhamnonate aldolase RhmA
LGSERLSGENGHGNADRREPRQADAQNNELVLCMGVNQLRAPNIAMIAAACGFDAVYIDLEHNPTSLETAAGVCVAALAMGITPIARVPRTTGTTRRASWIAVRRG